MANSVLARRLLAAIPTLAPAAAPVISLIHLIPGDPMLIILGEEAQPADEGEGLTASSNPGGIRSGGAEIRTSTARKC